MRRLHLQIFGALALTGLISVLLVMAIGALFSESAHSGPSFVRDMGALLVDGLPPPERPNFERALARRARRLRASISIWDAHGRLLGQAGRRLPPPERAPLPAGSVTHRGDRVLIALDDGRTLGVAFHGPRGLFGARHTVLAFAGLMLVLLFGSYLAARRITRRLELLERSVTRFGEGELSTRVDVKGRDEVAQLARAFNRSFERISGLLRQQRRMLQSASHELRSPLARVRMAFELLRERAGDDADTARIATEVERDITDLDQLIGDLLLAGRLTDSELPRDFAKLKVADLVAEEVARVGAEYAKKPEDDVLWVLGNARMLKSLVRNLLENAKRYGKEPVRAELVREGARVKLWLDDQGARLPEADHERIFEPFYRPSGHREGKDGGVGLGLALVRSIAEHHGGGVRYVPVDGHSRFEVVLPLTEPEAEPARA